MRIDLPADDPGAALALRVAARLTGAGFEAWLVGGCVRDLLLGRRPYDYDVATNALPEQTLQLFPRAVQVGRAFGVVVVVEEGQEVEVATFRTDGVYRDGRHPADVRFTDAREDALRRDFTINALLASLETGEVVDHVGGLEDLAGRCLRCVGEPERRFEEDALRPLRAVRLAADLGFEIDPATFAAVRRMAPGVHRVSPERVCDELTKGLTRRNRGRFLRLLAESGLMAEVLPELVPTIGCEQPPEYHPEGDVFVHTALVLDHLPDDPSAALGWAALLHDVGKPPTRAVTPEGRMTFHGHAALGAEMAGQIADRFKWSNALRDGVSHMVRRHMDWMNMPNMRKSTLRRWLASEWIEDEFLLHRADCLGSFGGLDNYEFGRQAQREFREAAGGALPRPLVTGKDLIEMGLRPGPRFKPLLERLLDWQLETGTADREKAVAHLRELVDGVGTPD